MITDAVAPLAAMFDEVVRRLGQDKDNQEKVRRATEFLDYADNELGTLPPHVQELQIFSTLSSMFQDVRTQVNQFQNTSTGQRLRSVDMVRSAIQQHQVEIKDALCKLAVEGGRAEYHDFRNDLRQLKQDHSASASEVCEKQENMDASIANVREKLEYLHDRQEDLRQLQQEDLRQLQQNLENLDASTANVLREKLEYLRDRQEDLRQLQQEDHRQLQQNLENLEVQQEKLLDLAQGILGCVIVLCTVTLWRIHWILCLAFAATSVLVSPPWLVPPVWTMGTLKASKEACTLCIVACIAFVAILSTLLYEPLAQAADYITSGAVAMGFWTVSTPLKGVAAFYSGLHAFCAGVVSMFVGIFSFPNPLMTPPVLYVAKTVCLPFTHTGFCIAVSADSTAWGAWFARWAIAVSAIAVPLWLKNGWNPCLKAAMSGAGDAQKPSLAHRTLGLLQISADVALDFLITWLLCLVLLVPMNMLWYIHWILCTAFAAASVLVSPLWLVPSVWATGTLKANKETWLPALRRAWRLPPFCRHSGTNR